MAGVRRDRIGVAPPGAEASHIAEGSGDGHHLEGVPVATDPDVAPA
jgi:hypothetical protein